MIDLHTHLLWDWDDGPDDRAESLAMCSMAEKDGTESICLTPHVFRMTRHNDDLEVLRRRKIEFRDETRRAGIGLDLHWGAEVYVQGEIASAVEANRLTVDETSYLFLEFDSDGVPAGAASLLARLMNRGFVPIISHPERNGGFAARPDLLYEFINMGCAAQVTAASLTGAMGKETRATAGLFLVNNLVQIIASDAHRAVGRPPGLSAAVAAAAKLVGESRARAMVTDAPRAILQNQTLPDLGEPRNPLRGKPWARHLIDRPHPIQGTGAEDDEEGSWPGRQPQ